MSCNIFQHFCQRIFQVTSLLEEKLYRFGRGEKQ